MHETALSASGPLCQTHAGHASECTKGGDFLTSFYNAKRKRDTVFGFGDYLRTREVERRAAGKYRELERPMLSGRGKVLCDVGGGS